MNTFVQTYSLKGSLQFKSIPLGSLQAGGKSIYVAGSIDRRAYFGQFDEQGGGILQHSYEIDELPIGFHGSVKAPNGDFILYGSHVTIPDASPTATRNHHLLMRVSKDGEVVWAKTYFSKDTRYDIALVPSLEDTYIFASWAHQGGSVDDMEIIKVDGNGDVLKAVRSASKHDEQIIGMIPWEGGCLLYGQTNAGPSFDGFLMGLDRDLQPVFTRLVGDGTYQNISAVLQLDKDRYVIAGEVGKERSSYVGEFNIRSTSVAVHLFDFKLGTETGHKILRHGPEGGFYLVCEMPSKPRLSFVALFGSKYNIRWIRRYQLEGDHVLFDLQYDESKLERQLVICGHNPAISRSYKGLLSSTDANMNSCITQDLPVPRPRMLEMAIKAWRIVLEEHQVEMRKWKPKVTRLEPEERGHCRNGEPLDLKDSNIQSPYIYLQTVGSTQADDSTEGFHLRWEFMRELGEKHLAKGHLAEPAGPYPTNIAFNRPNDFVRIYKTDFQPEFGIAVDLGKVPGVILENGPTRDWIYLGLTSTAQLSTDVLLRFTDKILYNYIRQFIDPNVDPLQFLASYTAPIELYLSGKLFFYVDISLTYWQSSSGSMRLETISLPDRLDTSTRHVGSRRIVPVPGENGIIGENIEYLRFSLNGAVPTRMYIIPYQDYIVGIDQRNGWSFWDRFCLDDGNSDANAEVFRKLEDPAQYLIHKEWRKFNEPTGTEFRVNVDNYQDRWLMAEGLKEAVVTYLDKSKTDPEANVTLPNQDPQANDAETDISYLFWLKFVGLDFHVARMLGLGAIDSDKNVSQQHQRVYLMQYHTSASLEGGMPMNVSHIYMAPPIRKNLLKLPLKPNLMPVVYGLSVEGCDGPVALTDVNGYVPFADVRYVNLHRNPFLYEQAFGAFWSTSDLYDLYLSTRTTFFGIEYAPGPVGAGTWVRPELSHDVEWLDPGGLPEVRPVPEKGENPVYTHGETQAGIHHYAAYSINWFSRSSDESNQVQTDLTVFDARNTLIPPSNFMVQLIQPESTLILTTQAEQSMYASLPAGDRTLVRATFNWNQVHNNAFQYADKVQFFFRTNAPLVVKGKVSSVSLNNVNHTAILQTTSYSQPSQPTTVQPNIAALDMGRFVGSNMVIDGEAFVVEAILTSGNNPQIRVKQIRQTETQESLLDNQFCTVETFTPPTANKTFILVENLDQTASWDTQLAKEVAITQFSPVHTELVVHPDGQSTTMFMGGLTGAATITPIYDPDPGLGAYIPAGGPPASQVPTGAYTLSFNTAVMAPHPDPDVQYYQGTVRLNTVGGEIRELLVWDIDLSGVNPVLTIFDPSFALKRDLAGTFIITAGQFTPVDGLDPIQIGGVGFANFHPGYRVYLYTDLAPGHNFGEPAILPGLDEGTKYTFMSVRSVDNGTGLNSYMATPSVLLAREIRVPVPPGIPLGNVYATRPNFYGKATFTFDVQVNQPYSLIFYKANERKILDILYHPDTVLDILDRLANLDEEDAAFEQNRWSDLVNMVTDAGGEFKEHVEGGFRFPPPTNPNYQVPDPSLAAPVNPFSLGNAIPPGSAAIVPGTGKSWAEVVQQAIESAFVPLTETPPVYSQIANDSIQTSGRPPKTRDVNGKRLPPGHIDYDPWPMIVKFDRNAQDHVLIQGNAGYGNAANRRFVRFTDYNLDGASKNTYFYFSKELSNTLEVSGASPKIGPVKLVNAAPAESPTIGRVNTMVKNSELGLKDGVAFELNEYLPVEGIRYIDLYRSFDADDALSMRTMTKVKRVEAGEVLQDTFDDLTFVPYAEPVYYRIIALREIQNERGELELIPSKPSNVVMASLIDTTNPEAPGLAFSSDAPIGSPLQLNNVVLSFAPTCHNGSYLIYKLSSGGNWIRIAEQSGNDVVFYQPLATSSLASGTLDKQDADLNYIFHQFKVVALNSSGLLSKGDKVLRI